MRAIFSYQRRESKEKLEIFEYDSAGSNARSQSNDSFPARCASCRNLRESPRCEEKTGEGAKRSIGESGRKEESGAPNTSQKPHKTSLKARKRERREAPNDDDDDWVGDPVTRTESLNNPS